MKCACTILPSVAFPALQYFSTLSHKRHYLKKKSYWKLNVSWFSLQLSSETFLIVRRIERDMIINVYWSARKVPAFLGRWNVNFLDVCSKNNQLSYFMKIPRVEAELFCANGRIDGRTDKTKLIVAFSNFVKAPKTRQNIFFSANSIVHIVPCLID
jgi:hypothetical protein